MNAKTHRHIRLHRDPHHYDPAHRLQTVTDSRGSKTLTFTYSPGGQRTRLQTSEGAVTSYGYDPVGRLTSLWAPDGGSVTLGYDPGGRLVEKRFPNGAVTRSTWNADNTLAQLLTQVGSTTISQHDYSYDAVGNRLTHTERIGGTTSPYKYVYDPLNRLAEVRDNTTNALLESYTHDVLGNRLSRTAAGTTWSYHYDAQHQELQEIRQNGTTLTTLGHDAAGNLAWRQDGTALTTYGYDPLNRLAGVSIGSASQAYGYDDQGRRIRKTIGETSTSFLYDGQDILAEYSTWATPLARYTHGPGIDQPLLRTTASGTQYYHADGLGSLIALSNPSGGLEATARYDAWGNVLASSGTIPTYGYTGREPDDTGLVYYRARYYDPTLGRFTQRDPIGLAGGINPYTYVDNNPINFTDPTGMWFGIDDAFFIVGGGVTGAIGQLAADAIVARKLSSRRDLASAIAGGAVAAEVGLYSVPTMGPAGMIVAGAAGGAVLNLTGKAVDRFNDPTTNLVVARGL